MLDEKLGFVATYVDGEKIAPLCREFGIPRVTGHNIIGRYRVPRAPGTERPPRAHAPDAEAVHGRFLNASKLISA